MQTFVVKRGVSSVFEDRRTGKLDVIFRSYNDLLLEKPEGKRPLGRPRRRWVDNIRMDLQEV